MNAAFRFRGLILAGMCMAALAGAAAEVLFDFETEEEREAVRKSNAGRMDLLSITNRMAAFGDFALRATNMGDAKDAATGHLPRVLLQPVVTNWNGFDRLYMDVVNEGDTAGAEGRVRVFLNGPYGPYASGVERRFYLRRRGRFPVALSLVGIPANRLSQMTRIWIAFESFPDGCDVTFDHFTLLKKGEPLPEAAGACVGRDILPLVMAENKALAATNAALSAELGHLNDYVRFCRESALSPYANARMALGWATSMEKVMPRGAFRARPIPEEGLSVRLAGNEYESVQILAAALDGNLKNVKVRAEGEFATNVECHVTGYVRVSNDTGYSVGKTIPADNAVGYTRRSSSPVKGWWPDPILGFKSVTDISGTDVQGFWVRVHCPENAKAGTYASTLVVSADGVEDVRIPLAVRVNGFTLPRTSQLPLAVSFMPETHGGAAKRWKDPDSPVNAWKRHRLEWGDFFADYLITMTSIYGVHDYFDVLERLKEQNRLGIFCLGYMTHPKSTNETDIAKWRTEWRHAGISNMYAKAKALGIEDRAYIYGWDEEGADKFPLMKIALDEVRAKYPGVPFLTTAKDGRYGVGTLLSGVKGFVPASWQFNPKQAEAARKEGRKVWWYICMGPRFPYSNIFIEYPAIEGRLVMGAQAVRMKPDGFLYYQASIWNSDKCIEDGPFVEGWNTDAFLNGFNGDGILAYVGPDGIPLPSLRLENLRDGLEDYAYAKLLEEKLREVESSELKGESEAWLRRAKEALAVPRDVMDSMTNYTDDSAVLYRWRDEMDLIEEAR